MQVSVVALVTRKEDVVLHVELVCKIASLPMLKKSLKIFRVLILLLFSLRCGLQLSSVG